MGEIALTIEEGNPEEENNRVSKKIANCN